jgi:DNA repair ATPase RecN
MDNELLLKSIENLLDKKLEPVYERLDKIDSRLDVMDERLDKVDSRLDRMDGRLDKIDQRLDRVDSRLDNLEKVQEEIKNTQTTIVRFITEADGEFVKLEEKTKDIDKIKKVINISNVK